MEEWLRWTLTVPLAGLFGLVLWLPPVSRWSRQIRRYGSLAAAIPEGDEKKHFEQAANAAARRIIDYTTLLPMFEKVYSWVAVVLVGALLAIVLLDPVGALRYFISEGPFAWGLSIAALLAVVPAVIGALLGRSAQGMSPAHYVAYKRRERFAAREQRVRFEARRRARRAFKSRRMYTPATERW